MKRLMSLVLALGLMLTFTMSVAAQNTNKQGAAGIIAALNNINLQDNVVQVGLVNLNGSLNNLTALNNVLNNSPILSNNNVTVTNVDVLSNFLNNNKVDITLENFLNENEDLVDVNALIVVLSSGDFLIINR